MFNAAFDLTQAKKIKNPQALNCVNSSGPSNISRDSIDAVVGSSITNLRYMEGEDLTQSDPSLVTTDLSPVDPSTPAEPYLAPRQVFTIFLLHSTGGSDTLVMWFRSRY